jgi:hypothetical protein
LLSTSLHDETYQWDEAAPLGAERLTLAQLLQARGAQQEAIDVASVFDSRWPLIYLQHLPASLALRAQSAKVLGNTVLEAHYRKRLSALRRPS